MRYDRGVILAWDMIFVTTLLSVPVILIIMWLMAS
jgi:predicted permease